MISPEKLRSYPFFGFLTEAQFDKVAQLAEEVSWEADEAIFEIGDPAQWLFLLTEGYVDLKYSVADEIRADLRKEFYVGEVNPGEPFGLSSLLGAKTYSAAAKAAKKSAAIRLDTAELFMLVDEEAALGFKLMQQLAKAIFERLDHVRVQLVAARN